MKEDAKLRRRFNYDNTYNFYKIMKEQQTDAGTNSWAIRWYWTNFKRDGYILSPLHSLVSNEGWDGSGVHCGESREPVLTTIWRRITRSRNSRMRWRNALRYTG